MGHFGTTPGLNLIDAHPNRDIMVRDLDMIYVTGPGHGGPGIVANTCLVPRNRSEYADEGCQ